MNTIVVGVDSSSQSVAALRWAADEARLRGATLKVVHAWTLTPVAVSAMTPVAGGYPVARDIQELEDAGRELLDDAVEGVELNEPGSLHVDKVLVCDSPARALLEAAQDADLLVVGSRGHGGFAGLLLGSVSQQVAHHATCPVVIIR